jgi:hypothetical protein
MNPTTFKGSNSILRGGTAEDFGTERAVDDLPIWRGPGHVISCWKLSLSERLAVLLTGRVWLHVAAGTHPPVVIAAENPFPKGGPNGLQRKHSPATGVRRRASAT